MRLHKNTYNPIPLFPSKEYWYDNKNTYHGVSRRVTLAPNTPLRFSFNLTDDALKILHAIPSTITFVHNGSEYTVGYNQSAIVGTTISHSYIFRGSAVQVSLSLQSDTAFPLGDYFNIIVAYNRVNPKTFYATPSIAPDFLFSLSDVLSANHRQGYCWTSASDTFFFTSSQATTIGGQIQFSAELYNCDNTPYGSVGFSSKVSELRSGTYAFELFQPSGQVLTLPSGNYYMQVTVSVLGISADAVYISEPFAVSNDLSHYVHIISAASQPINVGDATVLPQAPFEYYLQANIIRPPYQFDAEVEELDGYKFIKKLVSYKQGTFTFLATEYMADAIRFLWHCDYITFSQGLETYKVDYLEPPEISWDDDSHLCVIKLTYQCDTIAQSNGIAINS